MISKLLHNGTGIKAPLISATVKSLIYQHFTLGTLFMKFIQAVKKLDETIKKEIHINFACVFQ